MGVRILTDNGESAVLYCSTTDWAFGPVFSQSDDHDAQERAEAFLRWLPQRITAFEQEPAMRRSVDARSLTANGLENAYGNWLAQEADQWKTEEEAEVSE